MSRVPTAAWVIAVITSIALVFVTIRHLETRPIAFDSSAWKRASMDVDSGLRRRMVDNLLTERLRVGADVKEIVDLLGVDPPGAPFEDHGLVYYLGPPMGFQIDPEWLALKVKDGRVQEISRFTR